MHYGAKEGLHPHILYHKNQNRTQHKSRLQNRWANHTRSGGHGGRSGSDAEGAGWGHGHTPHPRTPSDNSASNLPDTHPVYVEVLPRPASDPLLIILPLLACLLLIIILIVLILVFRHRKEKHARMRLLQELAALPLPTEGSPFMGRSERSLAMPSVVVTPLGPASCPSSPCAPISPRRRRSLAPGMTFWGPFEPYGAGGDGNISGGDNIAEMNMLPMVPAGFNTSRRATSPCPTLRDNQYWV